jgi:hypothetical protein
MNENLYRVAGAKDGHNAPERKAPLAGLGTGNFAAERSEIEFPASREFSREKMEQGITAPRSRGTKGVRSAHAGRIGTLRIW